MVYFPDEIPTRLDAAGRVARVRRGYRTPRAMKAEGEVVRSLATLHIGTERRGEAYRPSAHLTLRSSGDPGEARFYLSLEDDLCASSRATAKNLLTRLGMEDGQAIESPMVTRRIEEARRNARNLTDIRKASSTTTKSWICSVSASTLSPAHLDGNTKDFVLKMIDAQLNRHLNDFLDQNYGAEAYAAYASRQLTSSLSRNSSLVRT